MLKHGAATQFEDADAETRSEAVTQFRIADAETQRRPPEPTMLKHKPLQLAVKADTVKSAIHVAETARELRC
jgi:hypothetical protein